MKHIGISFSRSRRQIAALAAILMLPAVVGHAAPSATWTGGVSTNWNDPGNWSGGIVPGDGTQSPEDVTIGSVNDTVAFGGTYQIGSLSNRGLLNTDGYGSGNLTINNGVVNFGEISASNFSGLTLSSGADTRNDGSIKALNHSTLGFSIGGNLNNNGLILAENSGLTIDLTGNLNNNLNGDITSKFISKMEINVGGNFNNQGHFGGAYNSAGSEIADVRVTGDVHNTGTIDGRYGASSAVYAQTGLLTNDGAISSSFGGATFALGDSVINNGSIDSQFNGATTVSSQTSFTNNGSITSSYGGNAEVDAITSLTNNGLVSASQGAFTTLITDGVITNESTGFVQATQGGQVDLAAGDQGITNLGSVSATQNGAVYFDTIHGDITNYGSITAAQGGAVYLGTIHGDITNHGDISAAQGGAVYIYTNLGASVTDGSITTDTGGSVIVTGDLTQTGGQTKVNGELHLNDGAGTFYLKNGGLGGGGTVYGSVVQDGGTFAPGDPTTTHISGDYNQNGGKTVFVIDNYHSYDQIAVGGAYIYTGGELDFLFSNSFLAGLYSGPHSFDFLTFTSFQNLSGGPLDIVTNLSPQYGFTFAPAASGGTLQGTLTDGTVPEPGAGAIFIIALSGLSVLLWKARRRTLTA